MDFWHCIIAHHEFRNEMHQPWRRLTKKKIPWKKSPWKKAMKKLNPMDGFPLPLGLGFFSSQDFKDQVPVVIRELTLRKICCVMTLCLGWMAVGTVGGGRWWWRKNPEVWGSLGVGYGLKTGWFPWTWFWDLRVNLGWFFLLESNLSMDPSHGQGSKHIASHILGDPRGSNFPHRGAGKNRGFPQILGIPKELHWNWNRQFREKGRVTSLGVSWLIWMEWLILPPLGWFEVSKDGRWRCCILWIRRFAIRLKQSIRMFWCSKRIQSFRYSQNGGDGGYSKVKIEGTVPKTVG